MKKFVRSLLAGQLLFVPALLFAQAPTPFDGCPGVSVAITRPGFNLNLVPHQIYLIDSAGTVTPTGDPINEQINAFGLNNEDGFLYGMFPAFNVANPFLARVGKNGKYRILGTVTRPSVSQYKVALINNTAATIDDKDNYYFTAVVINLQNVLLPPELYVGRIKEVSELDAGDDPLQVTYKRIMPGNCLLELLNALQNPLTGVLQDLAYNHADGRVYTYLPGIGGAGGKIASFNPSSSAPVFDCITPGTPNQATEDLSGLYFGQDSALYILTTDGKFYKGDVQTGEIELVTQTTLPLLSNNLRGDMASCVGKRKLRPFVGCPGLALAITRPGLNATGGPHQIFRINPSNGNTTPVGNPINLQINGFGLNNKDGFLYGMHEVADVRGPRLARVDSTGSYIDLDTLKPPSASGSKVGIINTAAATMDGNDNYYFTAVVVDTQHLTELPRLYLGTIKKVSKIEPGDNIHVKYERIFLGSCLDEILQSLSNPANGLLQDIVYNPDDKRIYTYIQRLASPAAGKLASFKPGSQFMVLNCINPNNPNVATQDLSGMHAGENGRVFILTTDGKYYRGNPNNGVVTLVGQTSMPLLSNNLRGDMASCIRGSGHGHDDDDDDDHHGRGNDDYDQDRVMNEDDLLMKVSPNPVSGDELVVFVLAQKQMNAELQVVDASGNATRFGRRPLVEGENQLRLPVRGLRGGVYAVVLMAPNGQRSTIKFIKL